MLNLIIAALLLSGLLVLILATSGILVGMLTLYAYAGNLPLPSASDTIHFRLTYAILLLSSFLMILLRHKRDKNHLQEQASYLLAQQVAGKDQIAEILAYRDSLAPRIRSQPTSFVG